MFSSRKKTNIEGTVAGGKVVHGTITSRSESSEGVSGPNGNKSPVAQRLKKSLSKVVTEAISKSSKGQQAKEPQEPIGLFQILIPMRPKPSDQPSVASTTTQDAKKEEPKKKRVLSETTTPKKIPEPKSKGKNTLVASNTMSIKQIQQRLNSLIRGNFPMSLIDLISNNHETINKSGNTDFMELILKAAHVKNIELKQITYDIAKEQNNLIFLKVVQNAIQSTLKNAIKNKDALSIVDIINNYHKIINKEISSDNAEIINLVAEAADVVDESQNKTAYEIAEEQEKKEFLAVVKNAREKKKLSSDAKSNSTKTRYSTSSNLSELGLSFDVEDDSLRQIHEGFVTNHLEPLQLAVNDKNIDDILVIMNALIHKIKFAGDQNKQLHTDNLHKAIEVTDSEGNTIFQILNSHKNFDEHKAKILNSFNSFKDVMPNAMEATDEEGKTPLDVAGKRGDHQSVNIDYDHLRALNPFRKKQYDLNSSPQSPISTNNSSLNLTPSENPYNPDDSGYSALGSLESDKAEDPVLGAEGGLELPKSDTESSLPSRIENLNSGSEKETKPPLQEELLPATTLLPFLKKGKPKGPSGKRPPSERIDQLLEKIEARMQKKEPTPVVIPVPEAAEAQDQVIEEPEPVVIPEHNAEKVPEQVKEEQAPDTGTKEDNAEGQMVLSHQEETPDNEDNESQIEQQTTLSNEDNNEGTPLEKQSNNRNFYIAGCAFLAVGCLVAAVIIQSLALLIIGALLVTGAGITSYLTPSTQVESMEINAHVNVEQTL